MSDKWRKFIEIKGYDGFFKKYTDVYFKHLKVDWQWFKAQAIAESNMGWNAMSTTGAKGIMQIMPETWKEITHELNLPYNIDLPEGNIHAGIYYDRKMWDIWTNKRTKEQRIELMFASYNAGVGNILAAQKIAEDDNKVAKILNTNNWHVILMSLKEITGKENSEQTIEYVKRIKEIYNEIEQKNNKIWKVDRVNISEFEDRLNEIESLSYDVRYIFKENSNSNITSNILFTIISKRK